MPVRPAQRLHELRTLAHRSGATDAEVAAVLPGDDLVPDATDVVDRAVTLPAPPQQVWPWLAQLGKGRAGWYFPAQVERFVPAGRRGLRHIDAALTDVRVGQDHADWGPGTPVLRIVALEPERLLLFHSLRDTRNDHRWPADGRDGDGVFAMSWGQLLTLDGPDRTRLHLRLRMRTKSKLLAAAGGAFDWATVELMFTGLRERVATAR
ncbi:hypothetical protein [uncultured Jatrophihabitans sp.]|uniref:hypothetical protein n=1 Tax=uncultured Jatrophihabitans sp. TaxID=1610747 RepID=UPI0035CA435B